MKATRLHQPQIACNAAIRTCRCRLRPTMPQTVRGTAEIRAPGSRGCEAERRARAARIELNEAANGGLSEPMPSPCRSLIFRVEHEVADEDEMNLGVQITTASGEPLSPGVFGVTVDLHFWSDLADVFVVPSTKFTLRYPNRVVGRGHVLDVPPF
jgi:hypothetical protein